VRHPERRGAPEDLEPRPRHDPERHRAEEQRSGDPAERAAETRRLRVRGVEDHPRDRPDVVDERHDPVDRRHDREPRETAGERDLQHQDLAGEPGERRDPRERQERGREDERRAG